MPMQRRGVGRHQSARSRKCTCRNRTTLSSPTGCSSSRPGRSSGRTAGSAVGDRRCWPWLLSPPLTALAAAVVFGSGCVRGAGDTQRTAPASTLPSSTPTTAPAGSATTTTASADATTASQAATSSAESTRLSRSAGRATPRRGRSTAIPRRRWSSALRAHPQVHHRARHHGRQPRGYLRQGRPCRSATERAPRRASRSRRLQ